MTCNSLLLPLKYMYYIALQCANHLQGLTYPSIYFFPAYDKKEPFKAYTDDVKALPLMLYIQKASDIKFTLPDLPHLPEHLHEEYYRQKWRMDRSKEEKEQAQREKDNKKEDL